MCFINETWLDSFINHSEIHIPSYSVIRRDRNYNVDGVCMYVRDDFALDIRSDIQDDSLEELFVKILLPRNKPEIVGSKPTSLNSLIQL